MRFLPESTCLRLNRKPDLERVFGRGRSINDLLDDETAIKHEKRIRKIGNNKEKEEEEEEAMVCVCVCV